MKTVHAIVIAQISAVIVLCISAYNIEQGDMNAVGMYIVVYLIPIILLALLNGLILGAANKAKTTLIKRTISAIPILICLIIA